MQKSTSIPRTRNTKLFVLTGIALFGIAAVWYVWGITTTPDPSLRQSNSGVAETNSMIPSVELGDAIIELRLRDAGGREIDVAQESDRGLIIVQPITFECASCVDVARTIAATISEPSWHIPYFAIMRGDMPDSLRTRVRSFLPDEAVLDDTAGAASRELLPGSDMPVAYFIRNRSVVGVGYGTLTAEQIKEKVTLLR